MKQNSVKDMLVKNLSRFIFGALALSFFNISAFAATLLLPAGSGVNDVAVDSISGTVYITKTNGSLLSSTNGVNFTQIILPLSAIKSQSFCQNPNDVDYLNILYKGAEAITVNPNGTLWMIIKAETTKVMCDRLKPAFTYPQNYLFRRVGSAWVERENALNPSDVGVSSSGMFSPLSIYITSKDNSQGVFYTGSATGNAAFTSTGGTGFVRVDSKASVFFNQPTGAWAVGANGTLWGFTRNVVGGSPWVSTGQINVKDVAVNKTTGRVYISKTSQTGGTIWYSDDNGATFQQEPATGFQNLSVTNNGVLYGAGYNGSLWRF